MRLAVVSLALALVVYVAAVDREIVEVEWADKDSDSEKEKIDWKSIGHANSYCRSKNKFCPGEDLEPAKFAPTPRQCLTRCNKKLDACKSFFYSADRICHLKGNKCTPEQLVDAPEGSMQLYRLMKEESCHEAREAYVVAENKYSRKFCVARNKSCPSNGNDLYRTPRRIMYMIACLQKCAKIRTCNNVDFKEGPTKKTSQCIPKAYNCPDEELVDSPGVDNFMRLEEGVNQCPAGRETIDVPSC